MWAESGEALEPLLLLCAMVEGDAAVASLEATLVEQLRQPSSRSARLRETSGKSSMPHSRIVPPSLHSLPSSITPKQWLA
jgi:hypothetical protein